MTSTSAREVARTSARRLGNPARAGLFKIVQVRLPPLAAGQILMKNRFLIKQNAPQAKFSD